MHSVWVGMAPVATSIIRNSAPLHLEAPPLHCDVIAHLVSKSQLLCQRPLLPSSASPITTHRHRLLLLMHHSGPHLLLIKESIINYKIIWLSDRKRRGRATHYVFCLEI